MRPGPGGACLLSWSAWRLRSSSATCSGSSSPGRPRKSSSSAERAELAAVVQHAVEVRRRPQCRERRLAELVGGVALPLRLGELALLGVVVVAAAEHVVAFGLQLRGVAEQDGDRGQEHRRGLAAPPGPDEPADRLREEQRGAHARRVHPDGQPRDVHPLGDHPDGDHPPVAGRRRTRRSSGWPTGRRRAPPRAGPRSCGAAARRRRARPRGRWRSPARPRPACPGGPR